MRLRQRLEQLAAGVGEAYLLPPLVRRIGGAAHEAGRVGAVDQLDHRVVPELKRIGDVADDGRSITPMAADREEQLVLRGRGAGAACGILREALEDPQRVRGTAPALGSRDRRERSWTP